jgi:hypothetical protein
MPKIITMPRANFANGGSDTAPERRNSNAPITHSILEGDMVRRALTTADYGSNATIRCQLCCMLVAIQPFWFASSYSAWVKVPTLVAGHPWAGP